MANVEPIALEELQKSKKVTMSEDGAQKQVPSSDCSQNASRKAAGVQDDVFSRAAQYKTFVAELVRKGQEHFLAVGSQYRALSGLLRGVRGPQRSLKPFAAVVARNLDSSTPEPHHFDGATGLKAFASYTQSRASDPQMIFLRGYQTAEWITLLGSQYRIDTEFFRQHLDFLEDQDFYDLPPCTSTDVLRLRIPAIFKRQKPWSTREVQRLRLREAELVRRHLRGLTCEGESMYRNLSIHNESIFTIEQDVSIFFGTRRKSWSTIVWVDAGRELSESATSAWQNGHFDPCYSDAQCVPAISHLPAKQMSVVHNRLKQQTTVPTKTHQQLLSHMPEQYGLTMRPEKEKADPFYALSELFSFYVSSENQYLNLLQRQVDETMRSYHGRENLALDDLHYVHQLARTHEQRVEDLRRTLDRWPLQSSAPCSHSGANAACQGQNACGRPHEAAETINKLLFELESLQQHACRLVQRAADCQTFVSSGVILEESRWTLQRANSMERLTLVAFFFLPLSLITGIFGTNFREFGTGKLSVWVLLVTFVPAIIFALVTCFWSRIYNAGAGRFWSNRSLD